MAEKLCGLKKKGGTDIFKNKSIRQTGNMFGGSNAAIQGLGYTPSDAPESVNTNASNTYFTDSYPNGEGGAYGNHLFTFVRPCTFVACYNTGQLYGQPSPNVNAVPNVTETFEMNAGDTFRIYYHYMNWVILE